MAAYRPVLLLFQPCSLVQEFPVLFLRFLSPTVTPFLKNILCACPALPWKRQSYRRQKIDIGRSSLAACLPLWQGSRGDRRQQSARFAAAAPTARTSYGAWRSPYHCGRDTSRTMPSMLQARACGTVYRRICDETWTLRVSSVNWKHFYSGVSQPRRIVTVCCFAP